MSIATDTAMVEGGFAEPVFGSQAVFSALLHAMSRPGTRVDFGSCCAPPSPLSAAQGAVLLALSDANTPVFIEDDRSDAASWLAFHSGAPKSEPERASFAVVRSFDRSWLERLPLGTLAYPDRSATVLVEVESLRGGTHITLEGPGIDGSCEIAPLGLSADFLEALRANRALFPCGLDLILTCGTEAMALQRTTRASEV